jgi:hypothetical protein
LQAVFESWGFTDLDLIDADALPAILADFQAEEQSVIGHAFGKRSTSPSPPVFRRPQAETSSSIVLMIL